MKHINSLIKDQEQRIELKQSTTPSRPPMRKQPEAHQSQNAIKILSRLQARYGHKFNSTYPTPEILRLTIAEWAHGLKAYTEADIERGYDAWKGKWPPGLDELQELINPPSLSAAHKPFLALPPPDPDPVRARASIDKMKTAIRQAGRA